jgi:LysR family transcriptional regulator (chromosome initiation inhibitor)
LLVQPALDAGELIDVATGHALSIALFWHCWNLESRVLARVSQALLGKARQVLQAV